MVNIGKFFNRAIAPVIRAVAPVAAPIVGAFNPPLGAAIAGAGALVGAPARSAPPFNPFTPPIIGDQGFQIPALPNLVTQGLAPPMQSSTWARPVPVPYLAMPQSLSVPTSAPAMNDQQEAQQKAKRRSDDDRARCRRAVAGSKDVTVNVTVEQTQRAEPMSIFSWFDALPDALGGGNGKPGPRGRVRRMLEGPDRPEADPRAGDRGGGKRRQRFRRIAGAIPGTDSDVYNRSRGRVNGPEPMRAGRKARTRRRASAPTPAQAAWRKRFGELSRAGRMRRTRRR